MTSLRELPTLLSDAPWTGVSRASSLSLSLSRSHGHSLPANELEGPAGFTGLSVGGFFGPDERYELLSPLGRGGTSIVHRVRDHALKRMLAGKFLLEVEDGAFETIQAEACALARLRHPHVVTVHDVGSWDGVPYLLMELLEGQTLAQFLSRRRLSPYRAFSVLRSVCAALRHAHQCGVLHLDLKPGNVHVDELGTVRLLDFGIGSGLLLQHGGEGEHVVGTPGYMAPEQWRADRVDQRTDVWALGVLMHECLSGQQPDRPAIARCLGGGAVNFSRLRQFEGVDQVVDRAVSQHPDQRFQSVAEFEAALKLVFRTFLASSIRKLPLPVVQVGACLDVLGPEFGLEDVQRLSGLGRELVDACMTRLVGLGFVIEQPESPSCFRLVEQDVARACFEELSAQQVARFLPRLLMRN